MTIVDSAAGVQRTPVSTIFGGTPEEGELDPHIWFSPERVKLVSRNIAQALESADPANKNVYRANLEAWLNEVDAVDVDVRAALAGISRRTFWSFTQPGATLPRNMSLKCSPWKRMGRSLDLKSLARSCNWRERMQ